MNKVILMGRLTGDPDIRYGGPNNSCIARYRLAVDRRRTSNNGEDTADFINCVAFGRTGEFAEKYLHKGVKIVVCGRIQTGSYTNQEGRKVYTTDVVVEEHYFAEGRQNQGNGYNDSPQAGGYNGYPQGGGYGGYDYGQGPAPAQNGNYNYGQPAAPAPASQQDNGAYGNYPSNYPPQGGNTEAYGYEQAPAAPAPAQAPAPNPAPSNNGGYGNYQQGGNTGSYSYNQTPAPAPAPQQSNGFMNIPDGIDEELPFN